MSYSAFLPWAQESCAMNIVDSARAQNAPYELRLADGSIRRAHGNPLSSVSLTVTGFAFFSVRSVPPPSVPSVSQGNLSFQKPRLFEVSTRFLILNFDFSPRPHRTHHLRQPAAITTVKPQLETSWNPRKQGVQRKKHLNFDLAFSPSPLAFLHPALFCRLIANHSPRRSYNAKIRLSARLLTLKP